jgi:hypothetical protein
VTLGPDQIGDRGQRYEVRYRDETCATGPHKVVGWTNSEPDAERMAAAWRTRPSTTNAWVADRQWAVSIYDADVYDPVIDASRLGMPSGDTQGKDST